ncbi:hypothetical protein [Absidia glauca]|uniref:AD domain-containing protein n=1 Tax=Absidia glauca TaxID=4829 RepID=A0A168RKK4_ABSGL|nr:hypothetical protein [Absidia glauca]
MKTAMLIHPLTIHRKAMAELSSQQQQQQQPRRKSVVKQQQQQQQQQSGSSASSNTPHSASQPPNLNNKKSLEWLIGRRIKVKTTLNEEFEGLIYTYDRITNCIALDILFTYGSRHSRKSLSFRILKIGHIKEIMAVTSDEASAPLQDPAVAHTSKLSSYLPVAPVNLGRLVAREADTAKGVKQQVAKLGVGVTEEAQEIFDALAKTLPCRWSNDSIIVMDEVIITPPYGVENCKANSTSAAFLARVKKVRVVLIGQWGLCLIRERVDQGKGVARIVMHTPNMSRFDLRYAILYLLSRTSRIPIVRLQYTTVNLSGLIFELKLNRSGFTAPSFSIKHNPLSS